MTRDNRRRGGFVIVIIGRMKSIDVLFVFSLGYVVSVPLPPTPEKAKQYCKNPKYYHRPAHIRS